MDGIGLRGGSLHRRTLPQLSRFGMNVAQIVARGRNSTSDNHCAINRSIGVQRHGVNQFLASRKYPTAHSSKLVCAIRQGNFCHCVMGGVDVARRIHALHAEQCARRSC
jgi:hypothetical protein